MSADSPSGKKMVGKKMEEELPQTEPSGFSRHSPSGLALEVSSPSIYLPSIFLPSIFLSPLLLLSLKSR